MKYERERDEEQMMKKTRLEREIGRERERGEGSARYGYIMSQCREQLRMLYVTGGECLEARVFITVFTRSVL